MNKECKRYLKQVRRALILPSKEKAVLLEGLQRDLDEYLCDHPNATYCEVVLAFEEPSQLALCFTESSGLSDYSNKTKKRHIFYVAIVALLTLIFLAMGIWITVLQLDTSVEVVETVVVRDERDS